MSENGQHEVTLEPHRAEGFADLIAEIAGLPVAAGTLPWLAPALLFSDGEVQAQLDLPSPDADEILLHDYQALRRHSPLPMGAAVAARVGTDAKGKSREYLFALGPGNAPHVEMKSALRLLPRRDVIGLKPMRFPDPQALADAGHLRGRTINQDQIDRYIEMSGDRNPIHSDPAEAALLGLPAPIVPGLLLASCVQPTVTDGTPGPELGNLTCRFMAPLCAGQAFDIALQSRGAGRLRAYLLGAGGVGLAVADLHLVG